MISDPDHRIHVGFGPGSWNAQLRRRLAAVRPNALPVLARFLTAAQQGASPGAGPAVSPQEESAGPFTELAPEPHFVTITPPSMILESYVRRSLQDQGIGSKGAAAPGDLHEYEPELE